jgi:hypothetical protein
VAETTFNFAKLKIADGTIILTTAGGNTETSKYVLFVSTSYGAVSNFEDQDYLLTGTTTESIAHFEASSGNMGSSARQTIGASTATEDDTGNLAYIQASSTVTFSAVSSGVYASGNLGAAVVFAEVAASDSSGRIPIAFYDTGFPVAANGGDVTVQFSTGGYLQLTS